MSGSSVRTTVHAVIVAAALASLLWAGCGGSDAGPSRVDRVFGPLPGALLSVAGSDDGTLWIAGSDGASGAYLARRAPGASSFARVDLGDVDSEGGALWWIHVVDDDDVLVAGERGRVFRVRGDLVESVATGTTATLYGIVATADRIYAVGGPPATLVSLGAASEALALPVDVPTDARLYKAFAAASGDVHVVGERGVHLVVRDHVVTSIPVPGGPRLVTVHGGVDPDRPLVAVGGAAAGYAIEIDNIAFRHIGPAPLDGPPLNGVFVGARRTIAVGFLGVVLERQGDAWRVVPEVDPTFDAHAVFIDRDDVAWVAGGRLLDASLADGALWRVGRGEPEVFTTSGPDGADTLDDTDDDVAIERCAELAPATELELGERDLEGCFHHYIEGGDAVVVNGPQGGSHVEVAVRFPAAGASERIRIRLALVVDATTVARFEVTNLPTELDPTSSGTRTTTDVPVIFAGADPSPWVGREARLEAEIVAGAVTLTTSRALVIVR